MDKNKLINLLIKAYKNREEVDVEEMGITKIDFDFKKKTIFLTIDKKGTYSLHRNNLTDNPTLEDEEGFEIWRWIRKQKKD